MDTLNIDSFNADGEFAVPIKRKKLMETDKDSKKFVQPTVQELNELKETENLFNNNLFRLQISELVNELAIKNKRKTFVTKWLNDFKEQLQKLPDLNILKTDTELIKQSTKKEKIWNSISAGPDCPFCCDQDLNIKLTKPEEVETFGLYNLSAWPGPSIEVNVNVTMPKSCFLVRDYSNFRYFVKRFYYLLYVRRAIELMLDKSSINLIFYENNALLPVLEVIPKEVDKIKIIIFATPALETFKPSRFLPLQNNVKLCLDDKFSFNSEDALKDLPTIFYNTSLCHDVTLSMNNKYIHEVLCKQSSILEGLKIICVWLRQRELCDGMGAVSYNLILNIIAYLCVKKRINQHMSSYQVVRSFWNFVKCDEIKNNFLYLNEHVSSETLNSFKESCNIVFLDRSGCFNVAGFLSGDYYAKLKEDCILALELLDENKETTFDQLFITKVPFELQYDLILTFTGSNKLVTKNLEIDDKVRAKYLGSYELFKINLITNLLKKGLNDRITCIVPRQTLCLTKSSNIVYGINLKSETAFNFMEMGPALFELQEAKKFREFWSDLATDRRFQDGSAKVAVYFKTKTIMERRKIIADIIDFLATKKLETSYRLNYNEFEKFVTNQVIIPPYSTGTNEEATLKVITIADDLGQKIRGLEMSLSITGIQGVSSVFNFTDVFPPIATRYEKNNTMADILGDNFIFKETNKVFPRYIAPIECVLHLEHSSKWPNDLESIRHLKIAFYLEISKLLKKTFKIISHVTPDYLEVFHEGLVFRYILYIPKEIGLLKQEVNTKGVISYKDTQETFDLEKKLHVLPIVNSALKGIHSQYPCFGPGTSLIKRWLRSHLIDDYHFSDVVVSLLSASLLLNGSAFNKPNVPQLLFWRFLKFFYEYSFDIQPVIVNFNDDISNATLTDCQSKMLQNRDAFPCITILIPFDNCQSIFTKHAPSKQIVTRVKILAESSLKYILRHISGENLLIENLFEPNWDGYDLIIYLKPLVVLCRHERIQKGEPNQIRLPKFEYDNNMKIPITGFNPVQLYLNELRKNYGYFAQFFYDSFGGTSIGVLWNPNIKEEKDFKVSLALGQRMVNDKLVTDFDGIIEDFYILGKGLVISIDLKK